jgi:hypothetical protein
MHVVCETLLIKIKNFIRIVLISVSKFECISKGNFFFNLIQFDSLSLEFSVTKLKDWKFESLEILELHMWEP